MRVLKAAPCDPVVGSADQHRLGNEWGSWGGRARSWQRARRRRPVGTRMAGPTRRKGEAQPAVSRKSGASGRVRASGEQYRTGYPLSTPHGITSVIKGEPNWSGSSTNRVCVACSRVWNVSIGAKRSAINTSNVPPRDDCSSRPAVPVLTFRPAARPRWPRGRQLGTTHSQQRRGTASVSVWSVWRFGLRGRALRINSAFRHPSSPSETAGSRFVGFRRAGAFGHPRPARRNG